MKASTTALSRLNQSNGVLDGSNGAFRRFVPGTAELTKRASPSRAPEPERMSPSISRLWSSTYCCAAKDPMLCPGAGTVDWDAPSGDATHGHVQEPLAPGSPDSVVGIPGKGGGVEYR